MQEINQWVSSLMEINQRKLPLGASKIKKRLLTRFPKIKSFWIKTLTNKERNFWKSSKRLKYYRNRRRRRDQMPKICRSSRRFLSNKFQLRMSPSRFRCQHKMTMEMPLWTRILPATPSQLTTSRVTIFRNVSSSFSQLDA